MTSQTNLLLGRCFSFPSAGKAFPRGAKEKTRKRPRRSWGQAESSGVCPSWPPLQPNSSLGFCRGDRDGAPVWALEMGWNAILSKLCAPGRMLLSWICKALVRGDEGALSIRPGGLRASCLLLWACPGSSQGDSSSLSLHPLPTFRC